MIVTGEAETKVLGTSFNVRAYPEEDLVEVTVETGKVNLKGTATKTEGIFLTGGKSGVYQKDSEELEIAEGIMENAQAWRKRSLKFEDTGMTDVILSMERYFDIEIEVMNRAFWDCPLTTTAPLDDPDIETVFGILEFYFDVEVERKGAKYVIVGGSCKLD